MLPGKIPCFYGPFLKSIATHAEYVIQVRSSGGKNLYLLPCLQEEELAVGGHLWGNVNVDGRPVAIEWAFSIGRDSLSLRVNPCV